MSSDLEFARRCCTGDRQAWEEFLVRYSRLIYSYIYSAAESAGKTLISHEKEDIFQEIVFSLLDNNFRKLKMYRALNGCSLASWLRQVTINRTLNRIPRLMPHVSLEHAQTGGVPLKDVIADKRRPVTETVQEQEDIGRLAECIERLELSEKYFLELNLGLGLSLEEIKEHLRISRGAADMRKQRIVARLRECFKSRRTETDGRR